jgi:hypothetical protein
MFREKIRVTFQDESADRPSMIETLRPANGWWATTREEASVKFYSSPLRAVLQHIHARSISGQVGTEVEVIGLEPYGQDMVRAAILRNAIPGLSRSYRFLRSLADSDIARIHANFGSILSPLCRERVGLLALKVAAADLRAYSLNELARQVGLNDDWSFSELVKGVADYGAAHVGDHLLRNYEKEPTFPSGVALWLCRRPQGKVRRRSELLLWLWRVKNPFGAARQTRLVQWLLSGRASEVFGVLKAEHRADLIHFIGQFLRIAACRVRRCFERPYDDYWYMDYCIDIAGVALEIRDAALAHGLPMPEDIQLPATEKYRELNRRRKAVTAGV